LSFGAWMTLSNIVAPLMVTADRFVASYLLGAAVVAYYTVPFDFIVRLLVIPAALTSTLFPRFAFLFAEDKLEMRRVYVRAVLLMAVTMLALSLTVALGAHQGLVVWLGDEFAERSWQIAVVLAVGLMFNGVAQIPHAVIQASGDAKATALLHTIEFILYVPILFVSLETFGLLGAAVVWTGRVLLDLLILLALAQGKLA
jgi:O-antigen/teichoic acid export membrane protein